MTRLEVSYQPAMFPIEDHDKLIETVAKRSAVIKRLHMPLRLIGFKCRDKKDARYIQAKLIEAVPGLMTSIDGGEPLQSVDYYMNTAVN